MTTTPFEVITEDIIGTTFYDLQTNGSLQNRMYCYDDGSIGAMWTMGIQAIAFADRGTGYNYYDGSVRQAQPTARIETFRAGWPSYAPWGPNGDGVITFITTPTGFPMAYREFGLSTMPTISISPDNSIAVIFSSTTETYGNFSYNYKKLWMRVKANGFLWGEFTNLTYDIIHIFDESIYPVAFPTFDGSINLIYNNDGTPGTALDSDHDYQANYTTYMNADLPVGINENPAINQESESLVISPNPSNGIVNASYSISSASNVTLVVSDISGRPVFTKALGRKDAGDYRYTFNLENLSRGIYYVSLKTNQKVISKKLVIN